MKICVVGASGSGKSELVRSLSERLGIRVLISYTTRNRRVEDGEIDGVHYHYVTVSRFNELKSEGFFIESEIFSGNLYGTAKEDVVGDFLCIKEPRGAASLQRLVPDIRMFWLTCPDAIRKERMIRRGDSCFQVCSRMDAECPVFSEVLDGSIVVDSSVDQDSLLKNVLTLL